MHVLRSRRVLSGGTTAPRAIWVEGERIARVTDASDVPEGAPISDFGDAVIMPGLVDTHVHVNEPGRTAWEGFDTATRAAAAGGVTTIVDMPLNSIPADDERARARRESSGAEGQVRVDVGALGRRRCPETRRELGAILEAGALGVQVLPRRLRRARVRLVARSRSRRAR